MKMLKHPGKVRHFQRLLTIDGLFQVCAIDHLNEFVELLGPIDGVSFGDVVKAKAAVIGAIESQLSAVLVDARYGMGAMIAANAVPSHLGLVTALEDETYEFPVGPRETKLRSGWSVSSAAACGADLLKLLWFYRPDLDDRVASSQRNLLIALQRQADEVGIPLVVEPIWYAVEGEDIASIEWRQRRTEGVVESALTAERLGVDMLKLEFPGGVATPQERSMSANALARIADGIDVPWVLLSGGVSFDDFCVQLEVSGEYGCSGYMAGRSVWRDAVSSSSPDALSGVLARIRRLNEVTSASCRAFHPERSMEAATIAFGPTWYMRD